MKHILAISAIFIPLFSYGQVDSIEIIDDKEDSDTTSTGSAYDTYETEDQEQTGLLYYGSNNLFLSSIADLRLWNYPVRGLTTDFRKVLINGLEWNLPENQAIPFSDLTGLYGNARIAINSGAAILSQANGSINGVSSFTVQPLQWHKSYKAAYAYTNGDSRHTLRLQYHTGKLKGGWAANFSFSGKYAKEGYTPGSFMNNKAFLIAIGKVFPRQHRFTLTFLGNSIYRSYRSAITMETAQLAGVRYNPNWGYQNGEKRSAKIHRSFQPAAILNYQHTLAPKTKINAALSFQTGTEGHSLLDWYLAENPYPDYYRNLPSYYYLQGDDFNNRMGDFLANQWKTQPYQLDWDKLYEANRANASLATSSQPALYVLSEDVSRPSILRAGVTVQHTVTKHVQISGGGQYTQSNTRYYRELKDLLGGNYFTNLNPFAFQSNGQASEWRQYDLKQPDRKVKPGEKYHHHYLAQTKKGRLWAQGVVQKGKTRLWMAGSITNTAYQRQGYYQNGIFKQDSYGRSGWTSFFTYQGKAGLAYNLVPQHRIKVAVTSGTNAPIFGHTFFNPSIRNTTVHPLRIEQYAAIEAEWTIHRKGWQASLTAFSAKIKNRTRVQPFYHDDYQTNVHLVLDGIHTTQTGAELAVRVNPFRLLTIDLTASWIQAFYDARPELSLIRDNDTAGITGKETIYWENYYAASGPQSFVGLQLHFHHNPWGDVTLSGTWQGGNYAQLNPIRHTATATYLLPEGHPQRQLILAQERLPSLFLINLEVGKALGFKANIVHQEHQSKWYLSAGVRNLLLSKQAYITYGREQLRFDFHQQSPLSFPGKYQFGSAQTYYVCLKYSIG